MSKAKVCCRKYVSFCWNRDFAYFHPKNEKVCINVRILNEWWIIQMSPSCSIDAEYVTERNGAGYILSVQQHHKRVKTPFTLLRRSSLWHAEKNIHRVNVHNNDESVVAHCCMSGSALALGHPRTNPHLPTRTSPLQSRQCTCEDVIHHVNWRECVWTSFIAWSGHWTVNVPRNCMLRLSDLSFFHLLSFARYSFALYLFLFALQTECVVRPPTG